MEPTDRTRLEGECPAPPDFLHELAGAGLWKGRSIPPDVARALRRHQAARLRTHLGYLRRKQEEFHRKMEEYIQSIRALIVTLEE